MLFVDHKSALGGSFLACAVFGLPGLIVPAGILGTRVIYWLNERCRSSKVEKIQDSLRKSEEPIIMGQGEYVVFKRDLFGKCHAVSYKTYQKIYPLFLKYSPRQIIQNYPKDLAAELLEIRYPLLKNRIKEIDLNLRIAFIPKALYELILVRQSREEKIKEGEECPLFCFRAICSEKSIEEAVTKPFSAWSEKTKGQLFGWQRRKETCWHIPHLKNSCDPTQREVEKVAYRLNTVIFDTLSLTKELNFFEISKAVQAEILLYQKQQSILEKYNNPIDTNVIYKAIALECSDIAKEAFILYRGSIYRKDSVSSLNQCHSLSFGTGLFAGAIYDPGAVAFNYMCKKENDAYAILVNFHDLNDSCFYIPPSNSAAQVYGGGEYFHGRTKIWKDSLIVGGIAYIRLADLWLLCSQLDKKAFIASWEKHKKTAIFLK